MLYFYFKPSDASFVDKLPTTSSTFHLDRNQDSSIIAHESTSYSNAGDSGLSSQSVKPLDIPSEKKPSASASPSTFKLDQKPKSTAVWSKLDKDVQNSNLQAEANEPQHTSADKNSSQSTCDLVQNHIANTPTKSLHQSVASHSKQSHPTSETEKVQSSENSQTTENKNFEAEVSSLPKPDSDIKEVKFHFVVFG